MLGDGGSSELLQSMRAHGNLMEHAPIALILLLLLEMQGVVDWKLHLIGSTFFFAEFFMLMAFLFLEKALLIVLWGHWAHGY